MWNLKTSKQTKQNKDRLRKQRPKGCSPEGGVGVTDKKGKGTIVNTL